MVKFLLLQIKLGKITLAEVPEKYKDKVKILLESDV